MNTTSVCGLGLTTSFCITGGVVFWAVRVARDTLHAYRSAATVNASVVVPHESAPAPAPAQAPEGNLAPVEGSGTSLETN